MRCVSSKIVKLDVESNVLDFCNWMDVLYNKRSIYLLTKQLSFIVQYNVGRILYQRCQNDQKYELKCWKVNFLCFYLDCIRLSHSKKLVLHLVIL